MDTLREMNQVMKACLTIYIFLFLNCQAHSLLWISVPWPAWYFSHTFVSHFECHLFREAPQIAASSVLFSTPLQLIRAKHHDTLLIQQVVCLSYVSTSSWDENPYFLITRFRVLSFQVIGWLSQGHTTNKRQKLESVLHPCTVCISYTLSTLLNCKSSLTFNVFKIF